MKIQYHRANLHIRNILHWIAKFPKLNYVYYIYKESTSVHKNNVVNAPTNILQLPRAQNIVNNRAISHKTRILNDSNQGLSHIIESNSRRTNIQYQIRPQKSFEIIWRVQSSPDHGQYLIPSRVNLATIQAQNNKIKVVWIPYKCLAKDLSNHNNRHSHTNVKTLPTSQGQGYVNFL